MDKRPLPVPIRQITMEIQQMIDSLKIQLDEHETFYHHALARGDWDECQFHRNRVIAIRNSIGRFVQQKLSAKS